MTHPRKAIRDAVVLALKGNTNAGLHVWASRVLPIWGGTNGLDRVMPAILVYTRGERAEIYNEAPREYRRTVTIAVELGVLGADPDDQLDDLARQVELQIEADGTLGGTASEVVLVDTQVELSNQGERDIGAALLTFDATYYDEVEQLASDALQTIHTEWDMADPDGQIDAADTITPAQ